MHTTFFIMNITFYFIYLICITKHRLENDILNRNTQSNRINSISLLLFTFRENYDMSNLNSVMTLWNVKYNQCANNNPRQAANRVGPQKLHRNFSIYCF